MSREEQKQRILDLINETKDADLGFPDVEYANGSDKTCPVSAEYLYLQIPKGKDKAVSLRKLAKENGLDMETAKGMIMRSVQNKDPIVMYRGKVWKPVDDKDMELLIRQENKQKITYR